MQNIGNTYQTKQSEFATSGKTVKTDVKAAFDFAVIFSDLNAKSDSHTNLSNVMASAKDNRLNAVKQSNTKKTAAKEDLRKDNSINKDNEDPEEKKTKNKDKTTVTEDLSLALNDLNALLNDTNQEDLQVQIDPAASKDFLSVSQDNLDLASDYVPTDLVVEAKVNQHTDNANVTDDTVDLVLASNSNNSKLLNQLKQFANIQDTEVLDLSTDKLKEFLAKVDVSSLSEQDFATFKFLKEQSVALDSPKPLLNLQQQLATLSNVKLTAATNDPLLDTKVSVSNLLNELEGKVNLNTDTTSISADEDFGFKDFENIENSLKLSKLLDDELQDLDTKEQINSIMDAKDKANANTLARSLELLKQVSSGMNVSPRLNMTSSDRVDSNLVASKTTLESALMEKQATAFSSNSAFENGSFSENSNSQHSFNQNFLNSLNQANKTVSTESKPTLNQTPDLLTLSKNLKENAEALTEKVMKMASRNLKSMVLDLNPTNLGKMKITLDLTSADEIAKISIGASQAGTRALVESTLDSLKETLKQNFIEAQTDVVDYEEGEPNHEQYASDDEQHQPQHESSQQKSSDNGILFASDENSERETENSQLNDLENINNSQNANGISYFA
ncbi:MAG: flagellar hook-length control protein FliK [Succinivibrio sp.]|nr:flagellar hook-length control protein FliK [Succinivibrio sp.]